MPDARRNHTGRLIAIGAGALTLALSGVSAAAWDYVPVTGNDGELVVAALPFPDDVADLRPGTPHHWQFRTDLTHDWSFVTAQVWREGSLVERHDGLQFTVSTCDVEWDLTVSPPTCAGESAEVIAPVALADESLGPLVPTSETPLTATSYNLGIATPQSPIYVLTTMWISPEDDNFDDDSLMGQSADLGFYLTAAYGDVGTPQPPAVPEPSGPPATPRPTPAGHEPPTTVPFAAPDAPSLASTGATIGGFGLVAACLTLVGAILMRRQLRASRQTDPEEAGS